MHIVVVGAGIIGLLSSWELRRRGHDVTVVSPDVGQQASRAAAGMLAPIGEAQFGQERLHPILVAARRLWPSVIEELAAATDVPHGYLENGTFLVGWEPADRQRLTDLRQLHRAQGMPIEPLTGTRLHREEPGLHPALAAGFDSPGDAQVDPRRFMAALVDALRSPIVDAPPVTCVEDRVVSVDRDPGGWRVRRVAGDVLTGDGVLLAAGLGHAHIGGSPSEVPLPLRPVYGDVLRLRVRRDRLLPGEAHLVRHTVRAWVRGRQVYLVPRADGGLVIGASVREDGFDGVDAGATYELLQDAIAVVPGVRDMELVEAIARARPASPDDLPFLGQVPGAPDGLVVSNGYSRHGVLLAPLAARIGAALVTGGDVDDGLDGAATMVKDMAIDRFDADGKV